eukprot:2725865-Pyramimonas_sp.AAC.2
MVALFVPASELFAPMRPEMRPHPRRSVDLLQGSDDRVPRGLAVATEGERDLGCLGLALLLLRGLRAVVKGRHLHVLCRLGLRVLNPELSQLLLRLLTELEFRNGLRHR